ncbi:class II fructose-bisphosphate aldolase [Maledivibacter halophilus]|uniref:Fructose-bisphosphate aldolase, class II n=1 Tax=Maledivibacter halophilus TaxID=36842 RepID=A0A1T5L1P2_9FIRM|nr:class II fructose-bisphosphate aldolase [Maledivibacter halophilus]SKC69539.1 fructose-bisphosphate aldolase, class II [Maledivibacter halophilus]
MIGDMKIELSKAKKNKYAIPAFNAINPLMIKKYIEVANSLQAPIIISLAEAHLEYMELEEALYSYEHYASKTNVPIILHLDHGQSIEVVKQAINLGFPSVMIDGSMHDFDTNVKMTKEIIEYSQLKGIAVEAEIGHVGAGENYETDELTDSIYTSVEDAVEFVNQTNVNSLAVSIGTAHGHYKGIPKLNFNRLNDINKSVDIPLVLHGGSSSGDDNLRKTIEFGISKINVFTDVVTSINKQMDCGKDYFTVLDQINLGIENCLKHYIDLFGTRKWSEIND